MQMKIMAILFVPLLLLAGNREDIQQLIDGPLSNLKSVCAGILKKSWSFFAVLILPSLVFWEYLWGVVYGLVLFGSQGAFNGGLYETLKMIGVPEIPTRLIGSGVFGIGILLVFWRVWKDQKLDLFRAGFWIFLLLIVASPVVHFWYLTWVVWFMILRPSAAFLALCGTFSVYFLAWVSSEAGHNWGYMRDVVVLMWLPFFLLFIWEQRHWRQRMKRPIGPVAQSISLVVPVYKEGEQLRGFLSNLQEKSPSVSEIVVVDGSGELSQTPGDFGEGIRVVTSERGRGRQIAKGIEETSSDLVGIIHADTAPQDGWLEKIFVAAKLAPDASAFALGQRFDSGGIGLLGVEVLNEMRATFGGSIFGDQTMVVRRESLEKSGGFPDQPLMEDVEVSWRLMSQGAICYLGEEWTVSAKKWQNAYRKRFSSVIGLLLRYWWARLRSREKAAELSKKLYQEYYQPAHSE